MLPRTLLVDDHPDTPPMYCAYLRGMCRCEMAFDGEEALQKYHGAIAEGDPFDVLILDRALPLRSGFEVAEEIRARGDASVVICFVSGYDDIETTSRINAIGALTMKKPVEEDDMREQMRDILSGIKQRARRAPVLTEAMRGESDGGQSLINALGEKRQKLLVRTLLANGALLLLVIGLQLFATYRVPRTYKVLTSIDKKLDGAVTTASLPAGYRVKVPTIKSAFKRMKPDKEGHAVCRVTFEFELKDEAAATSIAADRGATYWVSVTREK